MMQHISYVSVCLSICPNVDDSLERIKAYLPGIGGLGAMVGRGGVITPPPPHDPPVMEKSSIAMSPLKLLPLIPSKTI